MNGAEIYVLCQARSKAIADKFLNYFAKNRTQAWMEYPFPEFVDEPEIIYSSPSEVISRLEKEVTQSYSIYWNCVDEESPKQVMLFFTQDGHMIAGLGDPKRALDTQLSSLAEIVGGSFGYITSGNCPPNSYDEFLTLCIESTLTRIVEGNIVHPTNPSAEPL